MMRLAVKLLPDPLVRFARTIRDRARDRARPRVTRFVGDASVLQCCIAYNEHGGYCVPSSSLHRPAAQSILAGEVWEPRTLDVVAAHARRGDTVHAGTFFGDFLPALSRASAPGAKVWAFEPNPESHRCAFVTAYLNRLANVELASAGLGDRSGELPLVVTDADGRARGGASRLVREGNPAVGHAVRVPIVTIDEVVPSERRVSVIHLDVEGHEQLALSGALATIRRWRPLLVLETLPDSSWLADAILSLGYRTIDAFEGNTMLACA